MNETKAERFVRVRAEAIAKDEAVPPSETMEASGYAPGSFCAIVDFVDGSAAWLVDGSGFPGEMRAAANVEAARAERIEHEKNPPKVRAGSRWESLTTRERARVEATTLATVSFSRWTDDGWDLPETVAQDVFLAAWEPLRVFRSL